MGIFVEVGALAFVVERCFCRTIDGTVLYGCAVPESRSHELLVK